MWWGPQALRRSNLIRRVAVGNEIIDFSLHLFEGVGPAGRHQILHHLVGDHGGGIGDVLALHALAVHRVDSGGKGMKASSGTGAGDWGIWRVDPGPRGVQLREFDRLQSTGGVAPRGWKFDQVQSHPMPHPKAAQS